MCVYIETYRHSTQTSINTGGTIYESFPYYKNQTKQVNKSLLNLLLHCTYLCCFCCFVFFLYNFYIAVIIQNQDYLAKHNTCYNQARIKRLKEVILIYSILTV